jgi:hypothetical protein
MLIGLKIKVTWLVAPLILSMTYDECYLSSKNTKNNYLVNLILYNYNASHKHTIKIRKELPNS